MRTSIAFLIVFACMQSCNVKEKLERHEKAQEKSLFIMDNLTSPEVMKEFPEQYFPKTQTKQLISSIESNCDWSNRQGKFVDFYTMNHNGKNSTAYIYEYLLKCDSLRFVLVYDMEKENPELFKFHFEPLENKSDMIIDPSKQLQY